MKFSQAKSYLINLGPSKKKFSLDSIQKALAEVDNPHKKLKTIIVGGTNGKGSTSTYIANILIEAGYKVGLYNSPFVKEITETIQINRKPIPHFMFRIYVLRLKNVITIKLSYFEFKTLLVFYYFAEENVDVAVLEVGLGGKLDCTNVTNPLMALITNIELDHTDILGRTRDAIARDKIGIVKPGTIFITGEKKKSIQELFKNYCNKVNATFVYPKDLKNLPFVQNISPAFQKQNASLAMNAAQELNKHRLFKISNQAILRGIKRSRIIGRFDIVQKNPTIIFDIAHNPHGIETLINSIQELQYKQLYVVLGIMHDKDHRSMVASFQKIADRIIFTIPKIERSWTEKNIKRYKRPEDVIIQNSKNAYRYSQKIASRNDLILVTGSSYLVGELIP